jgi:hypothetical protein
MLWVPCKSLLRCYFWDIALPEFGIYFFLNLFKIESDLLRMVTDIHWRSVQGVNQEHIVWRKNYFCMLLLWTNFSGCRLLHVG